MYGGKDFSERGETLLQDLYILVIRRESLRVVSHERQEPVDFNVVNVIFSKEKTTIFYKEESLRIR